jgi:hypothetical protein
MVLRPSPSFADKKIFFFSQNSEMSSSNAPDNLKVLDGKVLPATKDEYKAALAVAKIGDDPDTKWQTALLNHKEYTTVTSPADQKTFQILKK